MTKILLVDIETAPNLGYVWGKWEQDVIEFKEDWYMLSFVAKWYNKKGTISASLPDFKQFKKDKTNDKELVKALWDLFNEADIIVAHNGNSFDFKKANARFIVHGLTPPEPYQTVDTKLVARRYFRFDSNKLDDLGKYLGCGRKAHTGGFSTWLGCMEGDMKSWKKMMDYNKQDVLLLEQIYTKMKPWMTNHPNVNVLDEHTGSCPTCGSKNIQKRGFAFTRLGKKQRYQCECGAWATGKVIKTSIDIR